jgi:transcriptional regulator with XRE-family HTH domain
MTMQKQPKAPDRFVRLLETAVRNHPDKLSLREVARRADISPAYLSRLISGERGVPSNDAIAQLEQVLKIPDRELFRAAARPDNQALEFFRKEEAGAIMRTLAPMPDSQLVAVHKMIARFVQKQRRTKSR